MTLLEQIAVDRLHYRKLSKGSAESKANATTLTTLYGEASIIGKNDGERKTTDDEVIKVIHKFVKGVNDNKKYRPLRDTEVRELELYHHYLPSIIEPCVVRDFVIEFLAQYTKEEMSMKLMGIAMGALKEKYPTRIDGRVAGPIIKELILDKQ